MHRTVPARSLWLEVAGRTQLPVSVGHKHEGERDGWEKGDIRRRGRASMYKEHTGA